MRDEYVRKFINYMIRIKTKQYHELDFDRKNISCIDVNLKVISHFNSCKNLKQLDGYNDLPKDIKNVIEEESCKQYAQNCIDVLGVYFAPTSNDKANILLSREKIDDAAKKFNIEFECLYNFVKIHGYAHASMCTKFANISNCNIVEDAAYCIIEESLATAVALKRMKNVPDYSSLESFVNNQSFQYKYGLELLKKYESDIENLMIKWKLYKCTNSNSGFLTTLYVADSYKYFEDLGGLFFQY